MNLATPADRIEARRLLDTLTVARVKRDKLASLLIAGSTLNAEEWGRFDSLNAEIRAGFDRLHEIFIGGERI